jgi:hypothetical protein
MHVDMLLLEKTHWGCGAFVVQDLELYLVAEVFEELVRARKGGSETRFGARGEQLGVDVSFVLRVLGPVEGGDRETAG